MIRRFRSCHRFNRGKVGRLIVAQKNRLDQFGFDLIRRFCESRGSRLIVVNRMILFPENKR